MAKRENCFDLDCPAQRAEADARITAGGWDGLVLFGGLGGDDDDFDLDAIFEVESQGRSPARPRDG